MKKLPEWVKTGEDYERWKRGEGPSRLEYYQHPQRNNSFAFYSIVIIIAISVVVGGAYFYIKGTPRYSLYQLRKAVLDRDGERALKYFDVDSVVDNTMKEVMEQDTPPVNNEWEQAGRNFGKMMVAAMMPTMKESLKSNLRTAITSNDKSNLDNIKKGSLWNIDIERDNNMALLTFKKDDSIKFRMVKTSEGYWKIVEIIVPKDIAQKKTAD